MAHAHASEIRKTERVHVTATKAKTATDEPVTHSAPKSPAKRAPAKAAPAKRAAKAPSATATKAPAKRAPRAKKADDLKLISGIGPKLEQVLNARGIRTFAAIAAWSDAEAAGVDADLGFDGRIARDDWRGQAKVLAAKGRKRS